MGHVNWGNLAKIRGMVYVRMSPFEQRAFTGMLSKGLPNVFRRFREKVFIVAPPFIGAYMIYSWAERTHAQMQRKNPADFENDC